MDCKAEICKRCKGVGHSASACPSKPEVEESAMANEIFGELKLTEKDKEHFFLAESLMASEDNPAMEAASFMVTGGGRYQGGDNFSYRMSVHCPRTHRR